MGESGILDRHTQMKKEKTLILLQLETCFAVDEANESNDLGPRHLELPTAKFASHFMGEFFHTTLSIHCVSKRPGIKQSLVVF